MEVVMTKERDEAMRPFDQDLKNQLGIIANTIRDLSMDAVQKADSGHPGLPMGCAEIGAYLYGYALRQNPKNSHWIDRDRFILSAGHGSMLLYSCLHLAGYDLSLDDIKQFRQLHSKTPGHPESHETDGVETTTGPLGQGFGNAVGTALGLKILAQKFNTKEIPLFDSKVFVLAGDGDMMEGISSEASSFAGHLKINNLIVIYDANKVSLDGPLSDSMSENTHKRYEAYGWDVYDVDGYDFDELHKTITKARTNQVRPVLIIAHTIIGKGSPHKAGTYKVHGSPLGVDEVKASKIALGLPLEEFYIPESVTAFFEEKISRDEETERKWNEMFETWSKSHPDMRKVYDLMQSNHIPQDLEERLNKVEIKGSVSGRKASQDALQMLADLMPQLYGGSADLSGSDFTFLKNFPIITPSDFQGRNIKFGVREFAMAAMATGLRETRMIQPFIGTFLTFSDYMRNAIRLASLMKEKVVYQFTHDSIFLGEDGPTHQPIEQLASLRAIPNLQVIRPSGVHETLMAWKAALTYEGPTAFALSRQTVQDVPGTKVPYSEGMQKGAYIVKNESGPCAYTLIATGSELPLAVSVAEELEKKNKPTRVISMPCSFLFDKQSDEYKKKILGKDTGIRVSVEAATDYGWYKYIGLDGIAICMKTFGASAPQAALAKEFGFTVEAILAKLL